MSDSSQIAGSRIAVIGSGIIGLCVAEKLQSEGHQVTIIADQPVGEGCSAGNAGHFATDIVLPLANWRTLLKVPFWLANPNAPLTIQPRYLWSLMPWLVRYAINALPFYGQRSTAALKALNRPAIEGFRSLLARHKMTDLMTEQGALTVFRYPRSKIAAQRHINAVRQHGVELSLLDKQQLQALEPELKTNVSGALYYPRTAHTINPQQMLTRLSQSLTNNGAIVIHERVTSIKNDAQGVSVQTSDGQSKTFGQLVIAAGIGSKKLMDKLGYKIPLEAERGYHLQLNGFGDLLQRPVTVMEYSFVMTPMTPGLRLAGTVELASADAPPEYQRSRRLLALAQQIFPQLNDHGASCWMGCRPSFPDSLPMIGRCPNHPNIIAAFGHQHLGLTQATVTADWVGQIVAGKMPPLPGLFAVDRF